ncbi:MAG TPA: acyl carrier protein [Candidatus Acidoferrum sp.]|nr:acyl carrier protein [Candidatus Acidoferrum sp.]
MDIAGKLKEILLQILDVKQDQIVPTAMFVEDLGATSLDVVEILTAIENSFNIVLDESDGTELKTVQDAVDRIEMMVGQKMATA